MLRTGIVPKDELTLEFQLESHTSRAERVRTSTRYQNREWINPFKVRVEVHAKKGGTVERLIKSFHPFNLLSASTFGVKRLFCMLKNPNILNFIELESGGGLYE